MRTKSPARARRKPAPAPVQIDDVDAPLSPEQRAASALFARSYGNDPAPAGPLAGLARAAEAETSAFDRAHALAYVVAHDLFALHYEQAYALTYTRGIHSDWIGLRLLVRDAGSEHKALQAIERAFAHPGLRAFGISSPEQVALWIDQLQPAPEPAFARTIASALRERETRAVGA